MATSNHAPLSRFLDRLLRRSRLGETEQKAILGLRSHSSQVEARRAIVLPAHEVDHACLVADGLAARFDQMRDGRRQFTAIHLPGDMCDLHSVVAPVPGWGIEALATTTVLHVPHSDLRALTTSYPAIALAFWRDTAADASLLSKWVANVGRKDARSRLAHLLCELGVRMEQAGIASRTEYPLCITQEQLADVLGLTSVHVNRTLRALRAEMLVRAEQRMIYIVDWQRLAAAAEFNANYLLIQRPPEQHAA